MSFLTSRLRFSFHLNQSYCNRLDTYIKTFSRVCSVLSPCFIHRNDSIHYASRRYYRKDLHRWYKEIYERRLEAGPDPEKHRSLFTNWNYDAELYSFAKRLSLTKLSNDDLLTVFTDPSLYDKFPSPQTDSSKSLIGKIFDASEAGDKAKQESIENRKRLLSERRRKKSLPHPVLTTTSDGIAHDGIGIPAIWADPAAKSAVLRRNKDLTADNSNWARVGFARTSNFIRVFLRFNFPQLPEEGILSIHDYLLSVDTLERIGRNLGMKHLLRCYEYPPVEHAYGQSLLSLIGCISVKNTFDQNKQKDYSNDLLSDEASQFICDFIFPQLISKNLFDLWMIENPCGILRSLVEESSSSSKVVANLLLSNYHFEKEDEDIIMNNDNNNFKIDYRIIQETGSETLFSVYHIGVYLVSGRSETNDKDSSGKKMKRYDRKITMMSSPKMLGKGYGETIAIAKEIAAMKTLSRLFGFEDADSWRLPFADEAKEIISKAEFKALLKSDKTNYSLIQTIEEKGDEEQEEMRG